MHAQLTAVTMFGGQVALAKSVMDQIAHAVGGVER
jgi:hypothetical protein